MCILIFPISGFLVFIEQFLLKIFLNLAVISAKIPFNRFYLAIPNIMLVFAYYAFIFGLIAFYKKHKYIFLKSILNTKYLMTQIKKYSKVLKIILVICFIIILLFQIIKIIPKIFRINFLDVRSRRLYTC